jgi:TonB family protein
LALLPATSYPQAPGPTPDTEDLIDKPVWLVRPPFAQLPERFTGPLRLNVALRCRVLDGTPSACAAVDPTADALVESASRAAGAARLAPQDGEGRETEGRQIVVRIGFPLPVAVDPPPAPANLPPITSPTWAESPTAADFARYYPAEALTRGVAGQATLDCIVAASGHLSCTVVSEEPSGRHFGEAALRVSRHFRMAPETRDGHPTAGGRVRIPIRFVAP